MAVHVLSREADFLLEAEAACFDSCMQQQWQFYGAITRKILFYFILNSQKARCFSYLGMCGM